MQESHAATSAICKYICKPQFLHAFAYASPCKPMQARCKSRASSCRRMRPEPNHSQCCQMFKKDESRLLEVVGSFPSMCLHVSVLCLDAWQHLNLLVHRACIYICKHDALAYASTMQKAHAAISAICKYICKVLAWYLHGIYMVFAWYLHGSCMHMQVPCKSEKPPLYPYPAATLNPASSNTCLLASGHVG